MLREKGRIAFPKDVSLWRREQLEQGIIEIPIDGEIGIRANELADFHTDPADRIIGATALRGHRLVTADERVLVWNGSLDRAGREGVKAVARTTNRKVQIPKGWRRS